MLLWYFRKKEEEQEFYFKMQNEVITEATNVTEYYRGFFEKLIREMDEFQARGSV